MTLEKVRIVQRLFTRLLIGLVAVWPLAGGAGDRVYLDQEQFIASAFLVKPQLKVLWLTQEVEVGVARILGHPPAQLRQRYWTDGKKTAWVLEEIGKEEPITAGFVVKDRRIEQTRVLVYRESRGMEVRYPAFINQFTGAALTGGSRLDRPIDGISGATLSVGAMERMARTALYFDRKAQEK